ncbi:MAG: hypothetical protein K2N92_00515 [Malacoplasma sp.]|nr:hypothetical protein [Malacoplasma sp.]MDE7112060.1 hypothetical protein [Malacoplasma sp.]
MNKRICILGTGAWATALGIRLSLNGATVFMYGVDVFEVNDINSGYNKKYFGENKFVSSLSATTDLSTAIGDSKFIILAFPSNYLIEVLRKMRTIISRNSNVILINTIKGLDPVTHGVLSKTIKKELKGYKAKLVTLSGPSLASDVFNLKPTIINVSGKNKETVSSVVNLFNSNEFKVIPITDFKGIQIYSSMKNLLAIGAGIVSEKYNSISSISALITLGLKEILLICKHMGAKKSTLLSFCGVGDAFLSCFSNDSRNFNFGKLIYNHGIRKALTLNKKTVEGYQVYKVAKNIIFKYKLFCPVFSTLIEVLDEKTKADHFVEKCWSLIS